MRQLKLSFKLQAFDRAIGSSFDPTDVDGIWNRDGLAEVNASSDNAVT
jgi:hypothetical protein